MKDGMTARYSHSLRRRLQARSRLDEGAERGGFYQERITPALSEDEVAGAVVECLQCGWEGVLSDVRMPHESWFRATHSGPNHPLAQPDDTSGCPYCGEQRRLRRLREQA